MMHTIEKGKKHTEFNNFIYLQSIGNGVDHRWPFVLLWAKRSGKPSNGIDLCRRMVRAAVIFGCHLCRYVLCDQRPGIGVPILPNRKEEEEGKRNSQVC